MKFLPSLCALLSSAFLVSGMPPSTSVATTVKPISRITKNFYAHAHSLRDGYAFTPETGWQSVNVSDLAYKYPSNTMPQPAKRGGKTGKTKSALSSVLAATVSHLVDDIWNGLKGVG